MQSPPILFGMPAVLTPRTRRSAALAAAGTPLHGRHLALDADGECLLFPLGEGFVRLGRSTAADIAFDDAGVSRRHAVITASEAVEILDDGSLNGTWVNGERVTRRPLAHGDVIRIGRTELRYVEIPADAGGDHDTAELAPVALDA